MDMIAVEGSSNIGAIGWEPPRAPRCAVRFLDGPTWLYIGVPADIWDAFLKAESKGKYFHAHIKGKYEAVRVEDVEGAAA